MQLLLEDNYSLAQIEVVARLVLEKAPAIKIFLFDAPLGGGKTTLIKHLLGILEGNDFVSFISSPTFTIVQVYEGKQREYYHIDTYRLESGDELEYLGIDAYLDGRHYCFAEWPEPLLPFISVPYLYIQLEILGEESRLIKVFQA
jgi:tRNA threonylcarbamoyladenosine biosynthesis protein TsaE